MKQLIIDPPSGWQYGFPKPIPEDRRKSFPSLRDSVIKDLFEIMRDLNIYKKDIS